MGSGTCRIALAADGFLEYGHPVAAVLMFVFIFGVVWTNAGRFPHTDRHKKELAADPEKTVGAKQRRTIKIRRRERTLVTIDLNRYTFIIGAMLATLAVILIIAWCTDWGHWVFAAEAVLLGLFLTFWTLQTEELWDQGLDRRDPDAAEQRATKPGDAPGPGNLPANPGPASKS